MSIRRVVCATIFPTHGYLLAQGWDSRQVVEYSGQMPSALERLTARWPKAEIRVAGERL